MYKRQCLLSVRESLFTRKENNRRFPVMGGESIFALKAWDIEAVRRALAHPKTSGFTIQGEAQGFVPGVYTGLHLKLHLPAQYFPHPRRVLEEYLRQAHVPYSLRRRENIYHFEVPKKGLKRKVVLGGFFESKDGFCAELEIGRRFDILAFLATFGEQTLHHLAQMQVSQIVW